MAPDSRRRSHDPSRPSKGRTRHTAEREERKEKGTPEKSRSGTPKKSSQSPANSPHKKKHRDGRKGGGEDETPETRKHQRPRSVERRRSKTEHVRVSEKHRSHESTSTEDSGQQLSFNALAQLNASNQKAAAKETKKGKSGATKKVITEKEVVTHTEREKVKHRKRGYSQDERRRVSGPLAEEGRVYKQRRSGYVSPNEIRVHRREGRWFRNRKCLIAIAVVVALLAIIIPVAIVVSKKKSSGGGSANAGGGDPSNSNLNGISQNDIPPAAKNSILDPFIWYDTTDFNVTYTNETVGGLPVMGLNSTWDDSAKANDNVPPLDQPWSYGKMPIRGVNIGGWLSIEPFITPSLFNQYKPNQGIVDEWTLTKQMGATNAAASIEKHYSQFITEQDFANIQAAGFDHVRIPYSYWAVTTYDGDPYVPKISWRYLLRGIEYARKHGLRVNLDLHGLPGSQNGWNHSGHQGNIGWLNGTDGDLNAQRSLDIHSQLSTFFAQPRYQNIITIYGLANEPKMTELDVDKVVNWTSTAAGIVRKNGLNATIAFGDGFLGLTKWQGQLQGVSNLVLDAHEYVIFDPNQISLTHQKKVQYACSGWSGQMSQSLNTATGFGPTLCGEWSQADTDCTPYLNDVGAGTRWEGTLQSTDRSVSVLSPACPSKSSACSCDQANADPSSYSSQYKQFLLMNAEAQMQSFETAWGWFYWTWTTESATQWDYKAGMANGILPSKTWSRTFNCSADISDFSGLSENY